MNDKSRSSGEKAAVVGIFLAVAVVGWGLFVAFILLGAEPPFTTGIAFATAVVLFVAWLQFDMADDPVPSSAAPSHIDRVQPRAAPRASAVGDDTDEVETVDGTAQRAYQAVVVAEFFNSVTSGQDETNTCLEPERSLSSDYGASNDCSPPEPPTQSD